MKPIKANLTSTEHPDKRIIYGIIVIIVLCFFSVSALNIRAAIHNHNNILNYQSKIDRLSQGARAAELHEAEIKNRPTDGDYEKNKKNAVFANRLITLDIFPWDKLLDALEKSVPEGITLSSFDPSNDFKQIIIKGRAGTVENIAYLLKMLEKSSMLQKSSLLRICLSESKPGGLRSVKTEGIEFEAAIFLKAELPVLK